MHVITIINLEDAFIQNDFWGFTVIYYILLYFITFFTTVQKFRVGKHCF